MPDTLASENNAPRIVSVIFTDTSTIVKMEKKIGYVFSISHESVLIDENFSEYSLLWARNIPKNDGLYHNENVRFQLGFAPMSKTVSRLDFVEGSGVKDYSSIKREWYFPLYIALKSESLCSMLWH